ncbi:161_t:CDS:2, partial [Dentiscutata heterogama]
MSEIKVESAAQLENEIKKIQETFQVKETEHTWQLFDDALKRLVSLSRGGAINYEKIFISGIKSLRQPILDSILTERTRLSGTATELVEEIGKVLGPKFDTLVESFVPAILKLCTRANKIFIGRAQKCMMTIIRECHVPNLIPKFKEALQGQSKILRTCASEFVLASIEVNDVGNLNNYIADLERIIREGAIDSAPAVRATSKKIFEIYKVKFDLRLEEFVNTLSSTAKKNLGIQEPTSNQRPRIKTLQKSRKYNTQQMQGDVIIYTKDDKKLNKYTKDDENAKDKKLNKYTKDDENAKDKKLNKYTKDDENAKDKKLNNVISEKTATIQTWAVDMRLPPSKNRTENKPARPPLPSRTVSVPVASSDKTKPIQASTNKKRSTPFSSYKPPLVKESKAAINSIPKPSKVTATATSTTEGLTTTATISVSISAASTPDRTQSMSKYAPSSARIIGRTKDRQYTPYEKPAIGFAMRKNRNRILQDSSELSAKLNAYANKIIEELTGQHENNGEDNENMTLELIPKLEEQIFETNTPRSRVSLKQALSATQSITPMPSKPSPPLTFIDPVKFLEDVRGTE